MSSYFVTQSGAGSGNGSSLGNAASVATYVANTMVGSPTAGDTVFFSGTISSSVVVATSGTGNGASRLTLDFSGATLTTVQKRINVNGKNYLNINGGGIWSNGSFTPAGIIGALDTFDYTAIHFNSGFSHDVTIQGFNCTATSDTGYGSFVWGQYCYNLIVQGNNATSISSFYYTDDAVHSHDLQFLNNYASTNHNVLYQSDVFQILDSYNVTIRGNKLINNAPNNTATRHNDVIQTGISGSGGAANPYNWDVSYNWIQLQQEGASDGNGSWMMMEAMTDSTGTALKVYGNVFVGIAGHSDNGVSLGSSGGTTNFWLINNTLICPGQYPGNTIVITGGTAHVFNNIMYDALGTGTGQYYNQTGATGTPNRNWSQGCTGGSNLDQFAGANGSKTTAINFTNAGTSDYSLGGTSTLRNAGDNTVGATYDQGIAFGATWPNPTLASRAVTWDPGAYQFVSGAATSSSKVMGKVVMMGKAVWK